ncbi:MAG: hypothetical protein Ct9H300mP12_12070 [Acidimicrobiales bacterium]|nr:MAG: hypothetical protein Ct9H300mP12_12070 [Acidimicrobiales bacterium]
MTTLAALADMDRLTGGEVLVAQNVAFAVMAITMIVAALRMVTTRNVVHAALYLWWGWARGFPGFSCCWVPSSWGDPGDGLHRRHVVLFLFGNMLTKGVVR